MSDCTHDLSIIWQTDIGLQAVENLAPSDYLRTLARNQSEDKISILEVEDLIQNHYFEYVHPAHQDRVVEADKVSVRIVKLLLQDTLFKLSVEELLSIHQHLFFDLYPFAGQPRSYNISKKECILDGESVMYGSAPEITPTIEYELASEQQFNYEGFTAYERISHYAQFIASLWQFILLVRETPEHARYFSSNI